ncbi:hypothetical protein EHS25_000308 [Saitozyma podzolica]|uniref:ATP synthase mitochondrial F1 complex assembly factor 1 n=1 Tax=Saitozyma podzolica TaxID=1890683 RepID=A0A427YVW6_9TREE|nr:hypothetical protein EHS25_000308 [Saitozyma podzolica]
MSSLRALRPLLRPALPGPSVLRTALAAARPLSTSLVRRDVLEELDAQLNPREIIERKRRAFEEKYGDKLKERVQAEGVHDLDALKQKVLAPSVKAALKSKKAREAIASEAKSIDETEQAPAAPASSQRGATERSQSSSSSQSEGDRAGIKPLSAILNLPLLHLTPHDAPAISQIWTTYHTSHPTLSASYLSASLPLSTYSSMVSLAQQNPFFILPLPRDASDSADAEAGTVKTDEYDMFYLQWLFHPTPTSTSPPSASAHPEPPPPTTSVIFTPLEEFKSVGEWAQPHLVLTHYPDLSQSHDVVLMRGEISPASAGGAQGSMTNPGFLLSQAQAQLLALALQRFYCADIKPVGEDEKGGEEREMRKEALRGLRERPGEWDWTGLVSMAYGGIV